MAAIDHRTLLQFAGAAEISNIEDCLSRLPKDGEALLRRLMASAGSVACIGTPHFRNNVVVSDHRRASSSWYQSQTLSALYWKGDLQIDGDLIDDDWAALPVLIVAGNLNIRNWLRGGMHSFVGGSVSASGFIIGHYNDSALFVGGDLHASGYLPCARSYHDLPKIKPHQIAGRIHARTLDPVAANDVRSVFVDDVLVFSDSEFGDEAANGTRAQEGCYELSAELVFARVAAGLPVWR